MYYMMETIKINLRVGKLDHMKMEWLAAHDDTSFSWQYRKALRVYLHSRKRTVYAVHGKDPLNDPPQPDTPQSAP